MLPVATRNAIRRLLMANLAIFVVFCICASFVSGRLHTLPIENNPREVHSDGLTMTNISANVIFVICHTGQFTTEIDLPVRRPCLAVADLYTKHRRSSSASGVEPVS